MSSEKALSEPGRASTGNVPPSKVEKSLTKKSRNGLAPAFPDDVQKNRAVSIMPMPMVATIPVANTPRACRAFWPPTSMWKRRTPKRKRREVLKRWECIPCKTIETSFPFHMLIIVLRFLEIFLSNLDVPMSSGSTSK